MASRQSPKFNEQQNHMRTVHPSEKFSVPRTAFIKPVTAAAGRTQSSRNCAVYPAGTHERSSRQWQKVAERRKSSFTAIWQSHPAPMSANENARKKTRNPESQVIPVRQEAETQAGRKKTVQQKERKQKSKECYIKAAGRYMQQRVWQRK